MLPSRRTIEAHCTDLGLMYHAHWQQGELSDLLHGAADRPHIRIHVDSSALIELADGTLPFRDAWADQRIRIEASMTDMLRLRAVL